MKAIIGAAFACALLVLCGCFGPARTIKVDRYCVEIGSSNLVARNALRIAVQQIDGRDPYHRDKILSSPASRSIDYYQNSTWSQPPCDMVAQELVAHLSRRFQYAALLPCVYKVPTDAIVYAYIDAFDQECRDGAWRAHIRVKYELLSGDGARLLYAAWFDRTRPLPGPKLPDYVAAQNISVAELFALIEADIVKYVIPSGK